MNQNLQAGILIPELNRSEAILADAGSIAGIGAWEFNFETDERFWSDEVYQIFGFENGEKPETSRMMEYFSVESRGLLMSKIQTLRSTGDSYDLQIELETEKGVTKWVRTAAKAIFDEEGKIVGARGIFEDIDQFKVTEKQLKDSLSLADNKNKQLARFANNLSNNLSSHTENFTILLEALALSKSEDEQSVILYQLQKVAATLEKNIVHLKAQLKAEQAVHRFRTRIRFDDVYDNVIQTLALVIGETETIIETDFTKAPELNYIPAYLESIFLNLISNAIKFKHPDRAPYIQVRTYFVAGKTYLEVKDNGVGIDLSTEKDVFALTSTNESSTRGIGLFLVRSQVLALGGNITIESKLNEGSAFIVEF
jgi:PAS domain S-box-containing protein